MINEQAYKGQEEKKEKSREIKEEKTDWEGKVKREFPYDWPECLAAIQTAESILGTEERKWIVNWEKVYRACQTPRDNIFSSLYNKEEVTSINQCYQQIIRGNKKALGKIYYFFNYGKNRVKLSQILAWLQSANCKLTSLNLWGNEIGAVGTQALAETLKSGYCKLTSLDLSNNQIGDTGAKEIAEALKSRHCKLTSLNLSKNKIVNKGAASLAEALKSKHCKLISLNFWINQIGDTGAKEIAEALKSEHCKLTSLNLCINQIGDAGAKEIADALKSAHCKLTSLDLPCNQIGDAGAKKIADALKSKHCKLTSLDLWDNQIDAAGAFAIALKLKHPNCPRDLHIELSDDMEKYISKFNEEWEQAQALYTLLSHPRGNLQNLSVLPPYVTIKVLFPYLFGIFKNGPQSQVGDCFLENHEKHFEMMQAQRQAMLESQETKSSGQELKMLPPCQFVISPNIS